MIGQNLDNPAFRYFSTATLVDHALQFFFHGAQTAQTFLNSMQVPAGDGVHLFARLIGLVGKRQQLADIIQTKTKFPAVTDEDQP